jgi:hypothetical protein
MGGIGMLQSNSPRFGYVSEFPKFPENHDKSLTSEGFTSSASVADERRHFRSGWDMLANRIDLETLRD